MKVNVGERVVSAAALKKISVADLKVNGSLGLSYEFTSEFTKSDVVEEKTLFRFSLTSKPSVKDISSIEETLTKTIATEVKGKIAKHLFHLLDVLHKI